MTLPSPDRPQDARGSSHLPGGHAPGAGKVLVVPLDHPAILEAGRRGLSVSMHLYHVGTRTLMVSASATDRTRGGTVHGRSRQGDPLAALDELCRNLRR